MTRINAGIAPKLLSNQHLIAEHREIKRIPNNIMRMSLPYFPKDALKKILAKVPSSFNLGKGHVTFFYDKIGYLHIRYLEIYFECLARGFKVTLYSQVFIYCAKRWPELYHNWEPTLESLKLIQQRLYEKDPIHYKNFKA